jgi:hypothetical protein
MSGDVERVAAAKCPECGHLALSWHKAEGCAWHGFGPHRCPCVLSDAQALLAPGGVVAGMVAEAWVGAADEPGEVNTVPTPSQLLRRLADADADQRLEWASRAIENAETVDRCFVHNHVGRIASLERQLRDARDGAAEVRARVEAVLGEWERDGGAEPFAWNRLRAVLADPDTAAPGPESATGAPSGAGSVSRDPGGELGPQIGAQAVCRRCFIEKSAAGTCGCEGDE